VVGEQGQGADIPRPLGLQPTTASTSALGPRFGRLSRDYFDKMPFNVQTETIERGAVRTLHRRKEPVAPAKWMI